MTHPLTQVVLTSFRWFESEQLLRRGLYRRLRKRERARCDVAPIVELILPVWTIRPARFAQSDAVLRPVPVARIGDEPHRNAIPHVDGCAQTASPVLRKRRNRKLQSDQGSARQWMRKTHFDQVAPGPF